MTVTSIDAHVERMRQDERFPDDANFEQFVRTYLRHTAKTLVLTIRDELLDFLLARYETLKRGNPHEITVSVENPEDESSPIDDADGLALEGGAFCTRIEVHMGDRPFIMTTLQEYFRTRDIRIMKCYHPVLAVTREPSGAIGTIEPVLKNKATESLVFLEVERVGELEDCRHVRNDLLEGLHGVKVVTEDFESLIAQLRDAAAETEGEGFPNEPYPASEVREFLEWMQKENFVFHGYRRYRLEEDGDGEPALVADPASSLGILRIETHLQEERRQLEQEIDLHVHSRSRGKSPIAVLRTDVYSRIYRAQPLDYMGVKRYDPTGKLIGEHVFVGGLSNRTITEKVSRIPILREKTRATIENLELVKNTHYFKRAVYAMNNMPKEELFYSTVPELSAALENILGAEEIAAVQVFATASEIGQRQSLIVVLPKLAYNDSVKHRVYSALCEFYAVDHVREYVCWSEEQTLRLHYYISRPGKARTQEEVDQLVHTLAALVRPWRSRVDELVHRTFPGVAGERLAKKYRGTFREEYQQLYDPETAVLDIYCLENLYQSGEIQCVIAESPLETEIQTSNTALRVFSDRLLELNQIVPILANFELDVLDEAYSRIQPHGEADSFIHTFHIRGPDHGEIVDSKDQERLADALSAILNHRFNDQPLNSLILKADLHWKEVDILLGYRNYYLQLNKDYIPQTVDQSLTGYPELARLFLRYFLTKFSPDTGTYGDREDRGATLLPELHKQIKDALAGVSGIAEDKILRNFWNLIMATVRTSYFKTMPEPIFSVKVDCTQVWEMPDPRPLVETYVHGYAIEGIHLRGGRVARGGLRWSDRQDDFRTEVLGLMKTQMIKNAVIVPVGAKGGFFPRLEGLQGKDRQDMAVAQYRLFIRGLLEISDSYGPADEEIRPQDVFAWDDFDPYLVVAADKGTATFSDIANELSTEYHFWLDDAFASGGSCGYSHKELGITARGGWECVKRHFREMGKDIQSEDFTCAGIGDMGGDVFGNAMILSKHTKLVAAFNHLHIFLDPDPDPASSFDERLRLFEHPKLGWGDYDRALISEGGGIFPRTAKVIPLTPQVRQMLGTDAEEVNGEELIRLILKAPVELLWNGGIGTYVKASTENHHEVRDKSNDRVRVDATELRCKVIGEGGNLGLTQDARIEFMIHGGRLNTDAIDNSGGVDLSDHEVNLKILMDLLHRRQLLADREARNQLLKDLTWEMVDLVLQNNYSQSLVISLDSERSRKSASPFLTLVGHLEKEAGLDRNLEQIGDDAHMINYQVAGHGIPRPKLAVLLAYAKRDAYAKLLRCDLPDQPEMRRYLIEYFPDTVYEKYREVIFEHRLAREIIATVLANKIVDQPGMTYLATECLTTGKSVSAVTQSYLLTDEFVRGAEIRKALFDLDNHVPAAVQYEALMLLEETIASITRFLLAWEGFAPLTWQNLAARQETMQVMHDGLVQRLPEPLAHDFERRIRHLEDAQVPHDLAHRIAFLPYVRHLLGLVRVSEESKLDLLDVAQVFFQVGSDLRFDWLQERAVQVARSNEWEVQFLNRLSTELYFLQGEISKSVIRSRENGEAITDLLQRFYDHKRPQIQTIHHELERMAASGVNNLIPIDLFRDHYRSIILTA